MINAECANGKCRILIAGTGVDLICEMSHIIAQVIHETDMPDDLIKSMFEIALEMMEGLRNG